MCYLDWELQARKDLQQDREIRKLRVQCASLQAQIGRLHDILTHLGVYAQQIRMVDVSVEVTKEDGNGHK